jgi:HSP20 family protein
MAEALPTKQLPSIFDELDSVRNRIMKRAYEIFQTNGENFGKELDNWFAAERELFWKPSIELKEKDNEFLLQIAVPGVDPKEIDIEVTPEDILVKANAQHEHQEEKGEVYTCELESGNLFRSIRLPKKIDPDKVKAEFKNGMLSLKAPVAEEARAKKVLVEAA